MHSSSMTLPLGAAATREVDLLGSFRYASTYAEALSLLGTSSTEGGLAGIERLVTHRFRLSDARQEFETMQKGADESGECVIKVVVEA